MIQEQVFRVDAGTHLTNTSWIDVELDSRGDGVRYRICWGQENPTVEEAEILYMESDTEDGDMDAYFVDTSGTIWKLNEMMIVSSH